jgi:hypothetical protein
MEEGKRVWMEEEKRGWNRKREDVRGKEIMEEENRGWKRKEGEGGRGKERIEYLRR